ncbi:MAG: Wzz/FepE/Etk N-terminal domain-containing protein [Alphaproteobacteria bacterium]
MTSLQEQEIDLRRLFFITKRNLFLIVSTLIICFLLALLYIIFSKPVFTATADVLIDKGLIVSNITPLKQLAFESSAIESEVEVIRSRTVANEAIKILKQKNQVKGDWSDDDLAEFLLKSIHVIRIGQTYVISINGTSEDPTFAASIANAFATAYINNQLNSISESNFRTSEWLQKKMQDLQQEKEAIEKQIMKFKENYNSQSRTLLGHSEKNDSPYSSDKNILQLSELKSLQQKSEAYSKVYNSYVEKLGAISNEEAFPVSQTRVITYASVPKKINNFKNIMILLISIVFGIGLGCTFALLIDGQDKSIRRAGQVKRQIGINFLGFFPSRTRTRTKEFLFISDEKEKCKISLFSNCIEESNADSSEVIHNIINNIQIMPSDLHKGKTIGVVTADDNGDGQSIIAFNLALCASQKMKTLVVDANPHFSNLIFRQYKKYGKINSLKLADYQKSILTREDGLLSILFLHDDKMGKRPMEFEDLKKLLGEIIENYELVVFICPPLAYQAEMFSYANVLDSFLMVAEWGKTLPNNLNYLISQNSAIKNKILGLVLENTHTDKMKRHFGYKVGL